MCTTRDMEMRLMEEGLNPSAAIDEKMCLLWKLLMSSEETVRALKQQIQDLHKHHNTEIEKVQQYVNDIKSLTKTRDSVALDLEQENQMLRVTLNDIHLQQETQRSEITEMLLQEGLADIIPISPSEQVAYVLADRASLLERIQSRTDGDTKTTGHPDGSEESVAQGFGENVVKLQSPWKKLLGFRKASQSKHKLMPAIEPRCSDDIKGRTVQELERDVEEASVRLSMAHKEIRRLTDELESAQLTQKAYEPELQEAQMEVEHLRREVEKLKRCELAELRKTKERNEKLEEELCLLGETKRLQAERLRFLERDASDNAAIPPKHKNPNEEDIPKQCVEEMQERLNMLRDLTQVTVKLRVEFEMEADLRRRTEEEREEHKKKRTEAERLAQNFQKLCEKQAEDYRSTVGGLQVEIRNLVMKLQKLETREEERHCEEHLKQIASLEDEVFQLKSVLRDEQEKTRQPSTAMQVEMNQLRALIQSRDVQDAEGQMRLTEELKSTKRELLLKMTTVTQLQKNISDLEQEQLKLQENVKDLENSEQETESLKTELQLALVTIDAQRSKYNNKQIHYKNKLSRAKGLYLRETAWRGEKIKDLDKDICIVKKQEEKTTDMMNMVSSENEALLQNKTDLLSQLHDLEEKRKNALDAVSSMQMSSFL
ncbi:coiled-coil domain-containing protein 30 isoform X2 [Triplophysa rosa]|uniref:coiled-coil domain-containing protein 30 isoform X2 n=1 Tax=Triplophysa rosa TaxID=992332 RepID=UPI0025462B30|nr:coiled-coil domain-containing protein 30 isoform X2 [Triplophysa rosa]